MKPRFAIGLALLLLLAAPFHFARAQQESKMCRSLDERAVLKILPHRVPLEAETIPVDSRNFSAIQFPDGSRIVIAPLITSGYSQDVQAKYQYVFVSETSTYLDRSRIPSGLIGFGLKPEPDREAPTRTLVARNFSGEEIDIVTLQLDTSSPAKAVSLVPKGEKEFELRIGRYVIQGRQK